MKSSAVALSLVPRSENCVRAVGVSCSADKGGEVPQENVFIYSYNILLVSTQGSYKLLSGFAGGVSSRLQGYRAESNHLC